MIYQLFTLGLRFRPIRNLMLLMKKIPAKLHTVNMLKEWKEKDYIFQNASVSLLGHGSLTNFAFVCDAFHFKNPLLITDPVLIQTGVVKKVINQLNKNGIKYAIFDGVQPNPSTEVIDQLVKQYRKDKCDALISVGGGSAHDSAKAACLILTNNSSDLYRFQGLNITKQAMAMPLIAINTTAGTGSGVTNVAVITDEVHHFKMTLVDKNIQPNVMIDDSDLMMGLPPKPTSWVGVDTLVHAIEADLSNIPSILTNAYTRQAMHLVYKYLPIVYKNPGNVEAREKMAYAEYLGGVAFNSASLGFVHSMSHAMSGVFNTPHGLANAVILPYVLDYEITNDFVIQKLCKINDYMGIDNKMIDEYNKAKECVRGIIKFLKDLNIPANLNEVQKNITPEQIEAMSKKAMKDFCGISNPVQFNRKQVIHIYENAIAGKFDHINE
ncbi:MAG: iron-containing alcohol dehydrogenase [Mycoplasmataceae bacterium]|jgi:alcohol dehydrogenase|nr:iron-containing alcohol dehydrogenase [Mycoplasmataceae bacterium]